MGAGGRWKFNGEIFHREFFQHCWPLLVLGGAKQVTAPFLLAVQKESRYSPFTCWGEYGSELESGGDSGRVLTTAAKMFQGFTFS